MPSCTPGSTTTTFLGLCKPADGETNWGTSFRTNMDAIDTAIHNTGIPRSYLAGLGTTPTQATTSVSIAAGVCMGNDQATSLSLGGTLVKVLSSAWSVGTGNGGLYAATAIQGNQSYHCLLIERTDTSVVDAYFDTSVTAANIPSPYTIYRRIASFKTDGNKNIQVYTQDGDYFGLSVPVLDFNTAPGDANAHTVTLGSIPTGVNMEALLNVMFAASASGSADFMYLSDLATTDAAPSMTAAPGAEIGGSAGANALYAQGHKRIRTNTSSQIRLRGSTANAWTPTLVTLGWYDSRGRNA